MNKDIRPYLHDLLARASMIRDFTVEGRDEFMTSLKTQESVIRCFEVIGEVVKRLPENILTPYHDVPWKQLAGFRDVLIHQYDKIKLHLVWDAVEQDVPHLEEAVTNILRSLEERSLLSSDSPSDSEK
ncbi:MAG: DUF86 domain-containing protein [Anaerolineae bacterium]|nr:DUF86 domain-containing protein [Anaerolineae bacterium]